jgi:hypothetical protein
MSLLSTGLFTASGIMMMIASLQAGSTVLYSTCGSQPPVEKKQHSVLAWKQAREENHRPPHAELQSQCQLHAACMLTSFLIRIHAVCM